MALTRVGKYDIVSTLGEGAGETYLGKDPRDGRQVVVRLLPAGGAGETLLEDARRIAALSHPAVPLSQVGLHGERGYMVTEVVNGPTLEAWLKQSHPVSDGVAVVAQLADAVNHIHAEGSMHRALRPAHVKLLPDGTLRLTDFAVGRDKDTSLGAAAYQAPEVIQGGGYTQKSEIYAAGLIFYEVLSGQNPFRRGTADGTSNAILTVQPTHLAEARKDVPRDLADAIMGCLEKDPDWRPKDLSYILELGRAAAGGGRKVKSAPKSSGTSRDTGTLSGLGARRAAPSRAPIFIAVGVGVVALGGAAAWYFGLLGPSAGGRTTTPTSLAAPTTTVPPATLAEAPSPAATASAAPKPSPSARAAAVDASAAPPSATPAKLDVPPTTLAAPPSTQTARVELPPETLAPNPTPTLAAAPATTLAAAPVSAEPAALKNVVPPLVRRHTPAMIDVHGAGLRPDHKAIVFKGRDVAAGFSVVRQRLVGPTLLQVVLLVDDGVAPGAYALGLADGEGKVTNTVRLEVAK